ncbi:MAG: hypothetical protein Barrevirus1_23 [Barrevirus sp.]|uniref:Uncharacterized protein n=1 Tax=Barrevirus sp. TaxID=2487763 RepID=A0A3G4ZS21_9VIRU|nr:MAG: hypothetical protein Barrevirus1_23 [Barrevirus sp.]
MSTNSDIMTMIQTNERQKEVARTRKEWDVVAYHQREIDKLYKQLKARLDRQAL